MAQIDEGHGFVRSSGVKLNVPAYMIEGRVRMEGVLTFSGLSYKATPHSPYTQIHYFATDVDPSTARIFADIVRSIRVARAHLD